ncbi:MAG TPA: spore coat U domain-containing protein [Gammaproteobacteria bacterium]|nr:spore coat U domain-containing protein [Gammaproteobacteria bacterium]
MKYACATMVLLFLQLLPLTGHACNVSITGLHFAAINPISGNSYSSTATVTISCPSATSVTVALSTGAGGYGQRAMQGSANSLRYSLYLDSAHTRLWGNGTSGTNPWTTTAGAAGVSHTVYGYIPYQPTAVPGTYSDAITVTVTY